MIGKRIAVETSCLRQPIRKALHMVAHFGADGVEFDARHELRNADISQTGLRHLRKILADLNLRVAALAFPTRRG